MRDTRQVERYDRGTLGKAERTDAGFLRAPAHLTRVGVFVYRFADGTERRELRAPEEVLRADSLATLRGVPLTDRHPEDFVTAKNARKLGRGHIGEDVRADGDLVAATVTIEDEELIGVVERGDRRELSAGYTAELDTTPGVFRGERYDARQINIRYNHVSIVDAGRAGARVKLHVDRLDAEQIQYIDTPPQSSDGDRGGRTVPTIKIDGVDYECPEQLKQAIEARDAKRDSIGTAAAEKLAELDGEVERAKGRADAAEAELVKATERADAAEQPEALTERVNARAKLITEARRWLDADDELDALTDDEILQKVVAKAEPSVKLDGRSSDYVRGIFELVSSRQTPREKLSTQRPRINDAKPEAQPSIAERHEQRADDVRKAQAQIH